MLPPNPPYTAFLGNLSYDVDEDAVTEFFQSHSVVCTHVRIPRDNDSERIKGFGYAEFGTVDDIKKAIEKSGEFLLNRKVCASRMMSTCLAHEGSTVSR